MDLLILVIVVAAYCVVDSLVLSWAVEKIAGMKKMFWIYWTASVVEVVLLVIAYASGTAPARPIFLVLILASGLLFRTFGGKEISFDKNMLKEFGLCLANAVLIELALLLLF